MKLCASHSWNNYISVHWLDRICPHSPFTMRRTIVVFHVVYCDEAVLVLAHVWCWFTWKIVALLGSTLFSSNLYFNAPFSWHPHTFTASLKMRKNSWKRSQAVSAFCIDTDVTWGFLWCVCCATPTVVSWVWTTDICIGAHESPAAANTDAMRSTSHCIVETPCRFVGHNWGQAFITKVG